MTRRQAAGTKRPGKSETAEEKRPATRERLLDAATDAFGRLGYDGASVRAIAVAAGANIQAITYHFGGKEGLYLEAAERLGRDIAGRMRETRETIAARLDGFDRAGTAPDAETAARLLSQAARRLADILLSPGMEARARFVIREQMERTPGFERIHRHAIGPYFAVCSRLIAVLLGAKDAKGKRVRLRTLSFMGGIMVFRFAHATLLKSLGADRVGPRDMADIHKNIDQMVASLSSAGKIGKR